MEHSKSVWKKPVEPTFTLIELTPTPFNEDELAIRRALAFRLGVAAEDLQFAIDQNNGTHVIGNVSNGYFIAVNDQGSWAILYDGQGTPSCQFIEQFLAPIDMVPECLDANNNLVIRGGFVKTPGNNLVSLDCGAGSTGASHRSVEYFACKIQDGLRSRNISSLLGYMADPFAIGYWRSEGIRYTPLEFINELPYLYNFNDPDYTPRLIFTTDRSQFPALDGMAPEAMFGPDVNIIQVISSQGWGLDGQGGALLFLTMDPSGEYLWHGMGFSADNFS